MQSRYMDETDKIIYVLGLILVGGFSLIFILYFIMNVPTQDVKHSSCNHSLVQLFFRAFLLCLSFGK